jgi:hypothetical protein
MLNACDNDFWKRIWSIPAPNKISLALRTNLIRRGVRLDDCKCLVCGRVDEDSAHLFVKCKAVKEVWPQIGMDHFIIRGNSLNAIKLLPVSENAIKVDIVPRIPSNDSRRSENAIPSVDC